MLLNASSLLTASLLLDCLQSQTYFQSVCLFICRTIFHRSSFIHQGLSRCHHHPLSLYTSAPTPQQGSCQRSPQQQFFQEFHPPWYWLLGLFLHVLWNCNSAVARTDADSQRSLMFGMVGCDRSAGEHLRITSFWLPPLPISFLLSFYIKISPPLVPRIILWILYIQSK